MKVKLLLTTLCFGVVMVGPVFAQDTITLQHWTFIDPLGERVRCQAHSYMHRKFMEKYPNIKLDIKVIGWQQLDPMLLRAVAAGVPPDTTMIYHPSLAMHVAAGSIQPLDRLVQENWTDEQKADFVAPWDLTVMKEHKYGFHYEHRITGMLYRKDILDKAGFAYPKTLWELAEQAKKLTNPPKMYGTVRAVNSKNPMTVLEQAMPIAYSEGGLLFYKDGRAACGSQAWAKTVDFYWKLVQEYKIVPLDLALAHTRKQNIVFYTGKSVFNLEASHRLGPARSESGLGQKIQFGPIPSFQPNVPSPTAIFGWILVMPKGNEHPEAAWKFIEHFISPEMQLYLAKTVPYMPVRKSVLDYPWFKTSEASDIRKFMKMAAEHPLTPLILTEHVNELFTDIGKVFDKVYMQPKRIDPLEALSQVAEKYNSKFVK